MVEKLSLTNKYINFIISPDGISVLEVIKVVRNFKIVNKFSVNKTLLIRNNIIRDNLSEALNELSKKYKNTNINIILNIPTFFTQKLKLTTVEGEKIKDIILSKLKEELPIPIENYIWRYKILKKNEVLILFFYKEVLNILSSELIKNKLLPLRIDPIFFDVLNFIEKKFSLHFDKSYIIFIYKNNVVTGLIWENGEVQNVVSELILPDEGRENSAFIRILRFLKENSHNPLESVFLISDKEISTKILSQEFNIINIKNLTNLMPDEIAILGLLDALFSKTKTEFELNIVNLNKEIALSFINSALNFWLIFSIIFCILINVSVWFLNKNLMAENIEIKNTIKEMPSSKINIEEIKNLTNLLNQYSMIKPKHYSRIKNIFVNLSKFKIIQINYTGNSVKIIIEETDATKIPEIKNEIKIIYPTSEIKDIINGLEIDLKL